MNNVEEKDVVLGPVGIGGWLIFPIIGFVLTIIRTLINLVESVSGDSLRGLGEIFSVTAESHLASLKIPMGLSFISGILVILSAGYCLNLIYSKKQSIIKFATAHYLILACAALIDLWGGITINTVLPDTPMDKEIIKGAMQAIVAAIVWIPYFHYSKRVKNTFIKSNVIAES